MAITVKCPNGHELHVKDKFAGQTGLCPKCQSRVLIPTPAKTVTEDAILELLGPPPPKSDEPLPVLQDPQRLAGGLDPDSHASSSLLRSALVHRGMKSCPKCRREVRQAYDICPHCRTYFTNLSEVNRRIVAPCKNCGKDTHLGDTNCPHCGVDLRLK